MAKRKIKKTSLATEFYPLNDTNVVPLSTLDLSKYCTKKLFQVILISETTPEAENLLKNVVKEGKTFESISFTHFITYDDVLEMVWRFKDSPENIELPKAVKICWKEVLKLVVPYLNTDEPLSCDILAQIVKIKIAQEMYKIYKTAVIKMKREKKLHEELANLAKCDEPKQKAEKKIKGKKERDKKDKGNISTTSNKEKRKGKSKSSKTTTTKISKKIEVEPIIEDYTEILLEDNEVVFDYNVDNQVLFFVLVGFPVDSLVKELFQVNVPLASIINFYLESPNGNVTKLFNFPTKFLEDTALIKFTAFHHQSLTAVLEKLLYVVKRINYVKRQHLSYIKNLTLHNFGLQPRKWTTKCFERYNKNLKKYPLEVVNIALILDSIIAEVSWAVGASETALSSLKSSTTTSTSLEDSCLCPSAIKEFLPTVSIKVERQPKTYQVHHDDVLNMTLNSYKNVGRRVYETTLKYLKLITTHTAIKKIDLEPSLKRGRDFGAPSEDFYSNSLEDITDILHLALFSGMQRQDLTPAAPTIYDFSENLETYNELQTFKSSYPQGDGDKTNSVRDNNVISNYRWKEDLGQSTLLQLFFKSLLEYSRHDQIFCKETKTLLIKFHDNLDDFGIGVKIFNQSLTTPVGLRDFCKYVTVEKGDWLEHHRVLEHAKMKEEDLVKEECQGLTALRATGLYEEYFQPFGNYGNIAKPAEFYEFLDELVNYPTSEDLLNFCSKSGDNSSFVAYDLGPQQLQLTGANVIFNSYDGVKITVDSGRFLHQPPQCCIKVSTNENLLVFWSADPNNFHLVLFDETILRFFKQPKTEPAVALAKSWNPLVNVEPPAEVATVDKETKSLEKSEILLPVLGVSSNKFPQITSKVKGNYEEVLEKLKEALNKDATIYKIFPKRPTSYLTRKSLTPNQPLYGIINRILFKRPKKVRKMKGYFMEDKRFRSSIYDLRIILPNGLLVTSLPPNRGLMEVKQSHQNSLNGEEFRIFYKTGVILAKNTDSSVKIFKANGDFIELSEEVSLYPDFVESEKISKILGNLCTNDVPYHRSRGLYPEEGEGSINLYEFGNIPYNKKTLLDTNDVLYHLSRGPYPEEGEGSINLYEFGNIPYNKKTLLDFSGKKITEHKGKVITKQLYHVVDDNDFSNEEKYFERDDGMTSLIDRKGKKQIEFSDGTRITAWFEVEKDLVHVGDASKGEGWVSVVICYQIQHPNYTTIVFNDVNKSTQICLNNGVAVANFSGVFVMDLGNGVVVDVSPESILLAKLCQKCKCDFICKINKNQETCLLEVVDTYNKILVADCQGNCRINSNYIKGGLNKMKCDHRQFAEEEKFFVINPADLSGFLFRPNFMAEANFVEGGASRYYNNLTKRENLEIFKKVFQSYNERFWMPKKPLSLTKLRSNEEGFVYYKTFQILSLIYDSNNGESLAKKLSRFLETHTGLSQVLIDRILEVIRYLSDDAAMQKLRQSSVPATFTTPPVVKVDARTVNEVIGEYKQLCDHYLHLIRNQKFSPYFQSACYEKIMANSL